MKKYISMMAMALMLSMGFSACDVETDEKPGGTNIQDMCGNWDVAVDAVDDAGNVVIEDPFGLGTATVFTYNTASNGTAQMWIDDQGTFWDYKFLVDINYETQSLAATDKYYNSDMEEIAAAIAAGQTPTDSKGNPLTAEKATLTDGKILLNGGKNIHGVACDSICFYISFTDDGYPAAYGYAKYRVAGVKHSGFIE